MTKRDKVFDALAANAFIDVANLVADRLNLSGVTVAVAINVFPTEEDPSPSPHVAMTVRGKDSEITPDASNRLFDTISNITSEFLQNCDDETQVPFDIEKHPGLLLVAGTDCEGYAYAIIVVDLPDGVCCVEVDETALIADIVAVINEEVPLFNFDERLNEPDGTLESNPAVVYVYGVLADSCSAHDYSINYKEEA